MKKVKCKGCGDELYHHPDMAPPEMCHSCRALRKTPFLQGASK